MSDDAHTSLTPVEAYLSQLGPGSRRAQRQALERIARYISRGRKGVDSFAWDGLNYETAARIRSWIGRTFQPATGRRMMSAMHQVTRMCWRLGLITSEQRERTIDTEPVRGSGPLPGRALRSDELAALTLACGKTPVGLRNRAIVSMLHYIGLRTVEVVRARMVDLDLAEQTVEVQGKGARRRVVPVTATALAHLAEWVEVRGSRHGVLFPTAYTIRTDGPMEPLTESAVAKIVMTAAERAEVQHFSPHDLRRTFVTRMLENGEDLEVVRQLCGHESIETTRRYDRRGWERGRQAVRGLEF